LLLPLSKSDGQARYRARQIFHWVYRRYVTDWDQMTDVSKTTRAWLKENVEIFRLKERTSQQALDGTMKFLWDLPDAKTIESVIIPAALKNDEDESTADSIFSGRRASDEAKAGVGHPAATTRATAAATATAPALAAPAHWSRLTACISSQVGCAM